MSENKQYSILNHPKLKLKAFVPGENKATASFSYAMYQNNPRINIYISKEKGYINAPMDPMTFQVYLDYITKAASGANDDKFCIENKKYSKETSKLEVESRTIIGKDAEGVVYVCVVSSNNDTPKIKFVFNATDTLYHSLKHKDGQALSKGEVSQMYALAHARLLSSIIPQLLVSNYEHVEYQPNNNNKGNYNKGNNNYNKGNYKNNNYSNKGNDSYSNSSNDANDSIDDSDIPF
jgi:hypothetical protein